MTAPTRFKPDIQIALPAWRRRIAGLARFARERADAAHQAAVAEGAAPLGGEVAIAFAGNAAIAELNRIFRGRKTPTNVLSFPGRNGGGDIMLALETVAAEAAAQGKEFSAHTAHLIVHGILHLMGYDHAAQGEARRMERLERSVLARFGIADPYVLKRTDAKP